MIVTLTPNPSLDRTIELAGPLERGEVQRAVAAHSEPGGKGVNICRALNASGISTLAILPGDADDPVLLALTSNHIPHVGLPIGAPLRSNVAITEPDGTTTKLNEPGPALSAQQQQSLIELVLDQAVGASWLVLAGSVPPGVPDDFYASIISEVRDRLGANAPKIAVDSSGGPLAAAALAHPDLLKPNAEELAELSGQFDADTLEANPARVIEAARPLIAGGVGAVLATLGAKGAVLVTAAGSWLASTAPMVAVSTVGAGDSALAGYLLSTNAGASAPDCLRQAAAHGAAAASLPGSTVPALHQTDPSTVTVTDLAPEPALPSVPATHPKEDDQ
ncbi:1-phosphofructokinase [Cryobacterium sp. PH29-G1]|uniref:1-phosphofructokinase family hexose kinase n=1 Tax=Cryobacterium sp. PH29-G1 TaxID=3046211 RepID=UPI0024BAC46F|nr:1-phosphofructokinase [Cryobacterium sp. PH29-G1]MDJ0349812.1 1-phosphofructokinase [Cryobacterium sp. PH29-G1]